MACAEFLVAESMNDMVLCDEEYGSGSVTKILL